MATSTALKDYTRTDLRTNVLQNPYWISSALVGNDFAAHFAVVFTFPTAGTKTLILAAVCEIVVGYAGATAFSVTYGTLDVPAVVEDSTTLTYSAADDLIKDLDITEGTIGFYGPTTANTSTWLTARLTDTWASPLVITGAATTVPCFAFYATTGTSLTLGRCRLHLLVSDVPGSF
jgi:hypothetical protein